LGRAAQEIQSVAGRILRYIEEDALDHGGSRQLTLLNRLQEILSQSKAVLDEFHQNRTAPQERLTQVQKFNKSFEYPMKRRTICTVNAVLQFTLALRK
jgi:hypothetical protein